MYDNNFNNNPFHSERDPSDGPRRAPFRPSDRLASLSMWCALFGIITFYTPPLALCLGSLAIILGLLSRGGQPRAGRRARHGIRMGIICMLLTAAVTTATLIYTFHQYGSLENFYKQYQKQLEKVIETDQGSSSENTRGTT